MSVAGNGEDCNGIGGETERRRGERKAKETGADSLTNISCFVSVTYGASCYLNI